MTSLKALVVFNGLSERGDYTISASLLGCEPDVRCRQAACGSHHQQQGGGVAEISTVMSVGCLPALLLPEGDSRIPNEANRIPA